MSKRNLIKTAESITAILNGVADSHEAAKVLYDLMETVGRYEHAMKNIQLEAMAHNQFAGTDHPRVVEIEKIATECLARKETE